MAFQLQLRKLVQEKIERDERLGDQVGGSGHSAFVSYVIDSIGDPERITVDGQDFFQVKYSYRLLIETEFTYYPDNPPWEIRREGMLEVKASKLDAKQVGQ